eukprot:6368545-Amphidinium_carterae.1
MSTSSLLWEGGVLQCGLACPSLQSFAILETSLGMGSWCSNLRQHVSVASLAQDQASACTYDNGSGRTAWLLAREDLSAELANLWLPRLLASTPLC